ncbi:MAG: D-glycero-beta-D-manno-heptose 1,7-bisphosphate 7-phosphatase [Duodenibacillus sp.]
MQQLRKAAFLDRDGVINIDHAYVHRWEEFEWVDGVLEAARLLHEAGYLLVIVTNQSGIGRGYYTEKDFECLNREVRRAFAQAGAPLAGIYFCPHHPVKALEPYRKACDCRKPAPGLLLQAVRDLQIDPAQSLMVGDKVSDMQAAEAAGVPVRILVGTDGKAEPALEAPATQTAKNLLEAVRTLLP